MSSISKYFWHKLQQSGLGMPNSKQFFTFCIETPVESFLAFFGGLFSGSSIVGWGCLLL
jgi:hypothetical protein